MELDRRVSHIERLLQMPEIGTRSALISANVLVEKYQRRDKKSITYQVIFQPS